MADIEITVDCRISGQTADFEYDDDKTFAQLIFDLQEQGMAWAPEDMDKSSNGGISIDGSAGHNFQNNSSRTLADLGVSAGSVIAVMDDITQAWL